MVVLFSHICHLCDVFAYVHHDAGASQLELGHDKVLVSPLVPEHAPEVWAGRSECPFPVFVERGSQDSDGII